MFFEIPEETKQRLMEEYDVDQDILDITIEASNEINMFDEEEDQVAFVEKVIFDYSAGEHARKFYDRNDAFRSLGDMIADAANDMFENRMDAVSRMVVERVRTCSNIK